MATFRRNVGTDKKRPVARLPGVELVQMAEAATRGGTCMTTLLARANRGTSHGPGEESRRPDSLLYSVDADSGVVREVARLRGECYNPASLRDHQEKAAFWIHLVCN